MTQHTPWQPQHWIPILDVDYKRPPVPRDVLIALAESSDARKAAIVDLVDDTILTMMGK